jgi:hypothetical protein
MVTTDPTLRYSRRAALYRMRRGDVAKLAATGITTPEGRTVVLDDGNLRGTKAEIIDAILSVEFPYPATKAA